MSYFKELRPENYYIFRPGNNLRRGVLRELFLADPIEDYYPDLLFKTSHNQIKATAILEALYNTKGKEFLYYDLDRLQTISPIIYHQFLSDAETIIDPSKLEHPNKELAGAIVTGIVKYDSRGYYFSPTAKERLI